MGFLKRLFGMTPTEDDDIKAFTAFTPLTLQMVNEGDRVYRALIKVYSQDFRNVEPSGPGLFKARLHSSAFAGYIFGQVTRDQETTFKLVNMATGFAVMPLLDPTASPSITHEEAKRIGPDYMTAVIRAVGDTASGGPCFPGHCSEGFNSLVDLYQESLADSIGEYTSGQRQRFDHLIRSGISSTLVYMFEWVDNAA